MLRTRRRLQGLAVAIVVVVVAIVAGVWWVGRNPEPGPMPPRQADGAPPGASPDGIPLASPHAGAVSVPSAPAAFGGPRRGTAGTDAPLSDRVVDYRIEARLDTDKHTLDGRETLVWRNRSAREVRSVYLHLYLNAFESSGSTFMQESQRPGFEFRSGVRMKRGEWGHIELRSVTQAGQAVPWTFVHPDDGPATDHTVVRLDLPRPVPAGASATLDIAFFDQLPRVVARSGWFGSFHLVGQWFPKIGVLELPGERGVPVDSALPRWNVHEYHLSSEFYADYGRFDVAISVPSGTTVGATGAEQEPPVTRDGWTTHRFVQGDVHDFAFMADRRFALPLEGAYDGPGSPHVTVRVLFPPEYVSNAAPVLKATLDALAWFSRTLGPYPYTTVTAVIPPYNADEAGGMEYPTFFTTVAAESPEPGTLGAFALDFVTIHEFGHGYFYGLLGSNEFEEPMLDEGLNEYWDMRMLRDRGQRATIARPWTKRLGIGPSVAAFDVERLGLMRFPPLDALGQNAWDRFSSRSYATVYSRTATAFRDLEAQIGAPAIERAFAAYYDRWKFRHPGIADLRASLVESTGRPAEVDALFAAQVSGTARVDDRIDRLDSEELLPDTGTHEVAGRWVEVTPDENDERIDAARTAWKKAHPEPHGASVDPDTLPGPFPYRSTVTVRRDGGAVPQTLVVTFADGSTQTRAWTDDARWKRFDFVGPTKLRSARLDPDGRHSLDPSKLDDGRRLDPDGSPARRWTADAAALAQVLFALVASL